MQEENELIKKLRLKDRKVFEQVFNSYYGRLCGYANRFIYDDQQAEEVVQEVFVRFWERCGSLQENTSLAAYLYRSVYNTCMNYLKHQKVKDAYRTHYLQTNQDSYRDESYEREQEELLREVEVAIDALPPRCSEIFKLSRYDGLKYQEIADHLSISVKTVEVQMGKALKVLRGQFRSRSN